MGKSLQRTNASLGDYSHRDSGAFAWLFWRTFGLEKVFPEKRGAPSGSDWNLRQNSQPEKVSKTGISVQKIVKEEASKIPRYSHG